MKFEFGDWVVYDPGYKQEIGRVTECGERSAHVCYHLGCTAASSPLEYLRPATDDEIAKANPGIGYHRFYPDGGECTPHGEWESISQTQEVRHVFCDCGYELGMDERDSWPFQSTRLFAMPNFCQECGRKIRRVVKS